MVLTQGKGHRLGAHRQSERAHLALAVARARLGFAAPASKAPPARGAAGRVRATQLRPAWWKAAPSGGCTLTNADVEQRFAGSEGLASTRDALARPTPPVDLYVATSTRPPSAGRSSATPATPT